MFILTNEPNKAHVSAVLSFDVIQYIMKHLLLQ
jgi:hypothetical protein